MSGLPATIEFAIKGILNRIPGATVEDVVGRLSDLGWNYDPDETAEAVQLVMSGRGVAEAGRSDGAPKVELPPLPPPRESNHEALPGVPLRVLPESLRHAVESDIDRFRSRVHVPVDPGRRSPLRWEEHSRSIRVALGHELAATQGQIESTRVVITNGQHLSTTGDGATVRYDMERDAPVSEGSHVQIELEGQLHEGEVVALDGTSICLWISGNLGTVPTARATLVVDASFLLRLRRDFLTELHDESEYFDGAAAVALLDNLGAAADDVGLPEHRDESLTQDQNEFVTKALRGGVSWLWGPPGTGKTTTLAHLLAELRRRDKRVLFVSNTNAAVDTALLRYLDVDERQPTGTVLRLGEPALSAVRELPSAPVVIEQIVAERGEEIGRHLVRCKAELQESKRRNAIVQDILRDPLRARDRGLIGGPGDDLFDLHRLIDDQDLHVEGRRLLGNIGDLVGRKRALETLIQLMSEAVVSRAQVVFSTVHRTYIRGLKEQRFDVVVLDEASMLSTDLAMIAAGMSSGHVVVAGDFRQLGPIATSDSRESQAWLRSSIFESAGVAQTIAGRDGRAPENLVALRTQHRMRAGIERLVGDTFYTEIGLTSGSSIATRARAEGSRFVDDLVLVDTSALRPWMAKRNGRWSRFNVMHAQVVANLLTGVPLEASVGVVSPFAPQAALLKAVVGGDDGHRSAATVHRFQGGERDVLIWDMTEGRAGGRGITSWFNAVGAHEEGARLINVALSRARDQLVVIADVDRARTACHDRAIVRRVLQRVERAGRLLDARDLFRDWNSGPKMARGALLNDPLVELLDASSNWATIWTAAPPSSVSARVAGALVAARERGVQVYVRAGVPGSQAQRATVAALQGLGCSVRHVRPCWENVALNDHLVLTSAGGLLDIGPEQLTFTSRGNELASAVARLLKRTADPSAEAAEVDDVCAQGHPKLLENGRDQDFTNCCPTCDVTSGLTVRTGRARARNSATNSVVSCRSCDTPYGLDGRCAC